MPVHSPWAARVCPAPVCEGDALADLAAAPTTEAAADVARLTAGYVIAEASVNGWIRVLSLEKAFLAAELGVPKDIAEAGLIWPGVGK